MKKIIVISVVSIIVLLVILHLFTLSNKMINQKKELISELESNIDVTIEEYKIYNPDSSFSWGGKDSIKVFMDYADMEEHEFKKVSSNINKYSFAIVKCKIKNNYKESVYISDFGLFEPIDDIWIYNAYNLTSVDEAPNWTERSRNFIILFNNETIDIDDVLSKPVFYLKGGTDNLNMSDWCKFTVLNQQ